MPVVNCSRSCAARGLFPVGAGQAGSRQARRRRCDGRQICEDRRRHLPTASWPHVVCQSRGGSRIVSIQARKHCWLAQCSSAEPQVFVGCRHAGGRRFRMSLVRVKVGSPDTIYQLVDEDSSQIDQYSRSFGGRLVSMICRITTREHVWCPSSLHDVGASACGWETIASDARPGERQD